MSDIVLRAHGLGKKYRISHETSRSNRTFRETIMDALRFEKRRSTFEEFWALSDVDFEIRRGDVVGIVGRNGAGKSTLLKLLSRITEPTTGFIEIDGRVASLLEVGTGFHPELTGRENVFLNGSILGMRREEVRRKFDEIVAFAEVDKFIDTPVKRYSSGMYMRLAFSVAAHLEPEILIVDEVLAVGDTAFQKKCLGRMEEVSSSGRTVLFVSHNLAAVQAICKTGLLLEAGRCVASGDIGGILKRYANQSAKRASEIDPKAMGGSLKTFVYRTIFCNGLRLDETWSVTPGAPIRFDIEGDCRVSFAELVPTLAIFTQGVRLFSCETLFRGQQEGPFHVSFEVPADLLRPGEYTIALGARTSAELATPNDWMWGTDLATFVVEEVWSQTNPKDNLGLINVPRVVTDKVLRAGRGVS